MKYNFTVTLTIKGKLIAKDLKSLADDIQATLREVNNEVGLGWDEANGEQFGADTIVVKVS